MIMYPTLICIAIDSFSENMAHFMSSADSYSSISSLDSTTPKAGMCIQQIDYHHLEDTRKKLSIHMQQIQKYITLIEEILQIQQDIKKLTIQKKLKLRMFQLTNSQGLSPV
jgi:microsomal dipeptidase-like Zn-dependent dipeptidase